MARRIRHIAIAVKDIEKARALFSMISGTPASEAQEVPDQRVKVSFIDTGETKIELIQPTAEDVGVAKFLEKRGEGLHHICLEVDDIEATLTEYKRQGIRLIDEQPRVGAEGHRVAFVHPQSTGGVLVEVEEAGH